MSEIEANFAKAIKFRKEPDDFGDRQEYLSAMVRKLSGMQELPYEKAAEQLSDEAFDWYEKAVNAMNKSEELPDFPDAELEGDPEDEPEGDEPEDEEEEPDADEEPEADEDAEGDDVEDEPNDERPGIAEAADAAEDAQIDLLEPDAEVNITSEEAAEPDTEPGSEDTEEAEPPKKAAKPKAKAKAKPQEDKRKKYAKYVPDYKNLSGEKNRYGVVAGTKADRACQMFEKGCRMRDVQVECGDRFYNMLKRLKKEGHRVEKKDHIITLTHADDVKKKKAK